VPENQLILITLIKRAYARWLSQRNQNAIRSRALLAKAVDNQSSGNIAGAERLYENLLRDDPKNADAHFMFGSMLGEQNRTAEAKRHLTAAIALKSGFADAHAAIGNIHLMTRNFTAARASYAEASRLDVSNPVIYFNKGLLAQCLQDAADALKNFERAWELAPEMPNVVKNMTLARLQLGQVDHAFFELQRINDARPDNAEVLSAIALTLQRLHRPQEALEYFEHALRRAPNDAELMVGRGIALRDLGRLGEAAESLDVALELQPGLVPALWHQSLVFLLQQDFARGWQHYDLRLRSEDRPQYPARYPSWQGEDTGNMGVLVYGEQGLGDEIMFASCLPELIAASRNCVIECSGRLAGLFGRSFPTALVRAMKPEMASQTNDDVDVQIAMGSVPKFRRQCIADFPRHHGYLIADPDCVERWRQRLGALGNGLRVGISWRGGTQETRSPVRSLPLDEWAPILKVGEVHFVDLQYADHGHEIDQAQMRHGVRIHSWPETGDDFEETAALVSALDLVVSVCTTVIHLAGALGKPVWVMAPYSPEWRYGMEGQAMPWYPSATIFRQPAYGNWRPVIEAVAQSLEIRRTDFDSTPAPSLTRDPSNP
jgi:tetratricopeptide (TPR) repeat protein